MIPTGTSLPVSYTHLGYDITYYTQRGMAAPLGVDDAIMTRLEEACAAAIEDPDFVTFMNNNGQAISYLDEMCIRDRGMPLVGSRPTVQSSIPKKALMRPLSLIHILDRVPAGHGY